MGISRLVMVWVAVSTLIGAGCARVVNRCGWRPRRASLRGWCYWGLTTDFGLFDPATWTWHDRNGWCLAPTVTRDRGRERFGNARRVFLLHRHHRRGAAGVTSEQGLMGSELSTVWGPGVPTDRAPRALGLFAHPDDEVSVWSARWLAARRPAPSPGSPR
jgi:hypothetical protein